MKEDIPMSKFYCNPVNCQYRYQFNQNPMNPEEVTVNREAADPSVIFFQGKYYLFASMTLSVWVSEDLVSWESHALPASLPLYGYAPDARVVGEYVYFTASDDHACSFYRTRDVLNGPYEEIPAAFPYTDPNLFVDEDGRLYFYWGCSGETPICGVELDAETLAPKGEIKELVKSDAFTRGYERIGEDHLYLPASEEEVEERFRDFLREREMEEKDMAPSMVPVIKGILRRAPYIEGAWMNRFGDTYYLQYAFAGTEYNIYGDGVFCSDSPLGPFAPAKNNPYSYSPGGFLPGAGHGSTFVDRYGNLWHAATMRISINHNFERRVGIWPAGVDADGELFCNQRYGDWPVRVCEGKRNPWEAPTWYLLSRDKQVTASSWQEGHEPQKASEEDVRTWWQAGSSAPGQWILMDLENEYEVRTVQIHFADDHILLPAPERLKTSGKDRYIEEAALRTRWILEGSRDGDAFEVLKDRSEADTDLPHDIVCLAESRRLRYLKLTILEVPYGQKPCLSGLRVFGRGDGPLPEEAQYTASRTSALDMEVEIQKNSAAGHLILWGHDPAKLYHSRMSYENSCRIGALVSGTEYFIRVDSFNENGITQGKVRKLEP